MRGDLVAAPLTDGRTRIALKGEYRPPLGVFGRLLDSLIGFRVAQATLGAFLEDVADRVETEKLAGG
jgi:hypothetical protein